MTEVVQTEGGNPEAEAAAKAAAEAKAAEGVKQEPGQQTDPVEPKEEPKEEPQGDPEDKSKELDVETWGDTGDEVGNAVLKELQDSGVEVDKAKALLFDAVQNGDASLIDHDALVEAVGKSRARLIEIGIKDYVGRQKSAAEAVVASMHEAAGGKDNWTVVAKWAKSGGVPEAKLNEYRKLIDSGGEQAAFAAGRLVQAYNADAKNTSLTGKTETPGPKNPAPAAEPLTAPQYAAELEKLMQGNPTEAQRRALLARRMAGKKKFGR